MVIDPTFFMASSKMMDFFCRIGREPFKFYRIIKWHFILIYLSGIDSTMFDVVYLEKKKCPKL
jgi:hypothetical protein